MMNTSHIGIAFLLLVSFAAARAEDWKMGGRAHDRNPVSPEKNAPTDWQIAEDRKPPRGIRWSVAVGTSAIGGPVVANGLIWVGTNNSKPLEPAIDDRGVLACFRESDGKFLYQHTSPRLEKYTADWPTYGLSGSPIVEGEKLWFITNRREVVCLDTGSINRGEGAPKVLWKYDLVKEQGIFPNSPHIHGHNTLGSLAIHNDLLFVPTGNGVGVDHPGAHKIRAPEAPSIVCLRKETGAVVWKDNSAGKLGYGGHCASPLVVEIGGTVQVIHPQADGWIRSYQAETGKLIWSFDTNHKGAVWDWTAPEETEKRTVVATPVFAEGRVYVAAGREPEFCDLQGRLFCIDPTKTGDISPELDDGKGGGMMNRNSGLIWDFTKDGKEDSDMMHQATSSVAVHGGLVIAPDLSGYVHCFDAKTGKRHWSHDTLAQVFGDPLIVDGKIYVADEDGDVVILELSRTLKVIAEHAMDRTIIAPPVFANGILYIQSRSMLHAIGAEP